MILKDYDEQSVVYANFTTRLQALIDEIVRSSGIIPQSISGRLKPRTSLEEKISRPGKTYSQLAEVTDVSGVRVITYFPAEVDQVAALLEKEFKLHREDCVDKRIYDDADRFGYKSLHYVVSLKSDRANLTCRIYFFGSSYR